MKAVPAPLCFCWISLMLFVASATHAQPIDLESDAPPASPSVQDAVPMAPPPVETIPAPVPVTPDAATPTPTVTDDPGDFGDRAERVVEQAQQTLDDLTANLDRNPQALEISAGVLKPIYQLAETMESRWFHWAAFAIMLSGVVSFALQLILGKLVVLTKRGFSVTEILSDLQGLAISLVGLVLTTQAAAQNSEFTQSAVSVLSAAVTGLILGLLFYVWGQSQEVAAAKGRRAKS